jgi:DNA-binding CsgD family transcriptional regulator
MYDKVTLQNNKNSGSPLGNSLYENGSGVFIRTEGDLSDRQVEFIMKGGTIRGNINNVRNSYACGGGVYISGYGIFTMEGGVIMNNTARITGGGFHTGGRGSFTKTGGIIYGSNALVALRNTAIEGTGSPKTYGHAVCVAVVQPAYQYRNDTVGENDNLSYVGMPTYEGYHIFGEGDKWDDPDKAFRRILLAIILPVLSLSACGFLILRRKYQKKLMKLAQEAADQSVNIGADAVLDSIFEDAKLTAREKEIGKLLLTKLTMKQIASFLKTPYTTADYHVRKVYRKLGVQGRTELIIRMKREEEEGTGGLGD